MVKAIKVMLIPNNVQKTKLFQYAGASRFAYNWALAREISLPLLIPFPQLMRIMIFSQRISWEAKMEVER